MDAPNVDEQNDSDREEVKSKAAISPISDGTSKAPSSPSVAPNSSQKSAAKPKRKKTKTVTCLLGLASSFFKESPRTAHVKSESMSPQNSFFGINKSPSIPQTVGTTATSNFQQQNENGDNRVGETSRQTTLSEQLLSQTIESVLPQLSNWTRSDYSTFIEALFVTGDERDVRSRHCLG